MSRNKNFMIKENFNLAVKNHQEGKTNIWSRPFRASNKPDHWDPLIRH